MTGFDNILYVVLIFLIFILYRELATQIYEVISSICTYHPRFRTVLFVGGTDMKESVAKYEKEGGQLIIATPGRLLEVKKYREQLLSFKKLEVYFTFQA